MRYIWFILFGLFLLYALGENGNTNIFGFEKQKGPDSTPYATVVSGNTNSASVVQASNQIDKLTGVAKRCKDCIESCSSTTWLILIGVLFLCILMMLPRCQKYIKSTFKWKKKKKKKSETYE